MLCATDSLICQQQQRRSSAERRIGDLCIHSNAVCCHEDLDERMKESNLGEKFLHWIRRIKDDWEDTKDYSEVATASELVAQHRPRRRKA